MNASILESAAIREAFAEQEARPCVPQRTPVKYLYRAGDRVRLSHSYLFLRVSGYANRMQAATKRGTVTADVREGERAGTVAVLWDTMPGYCTCVHLDNVTLASDGDLPPHTSAARWAPATTTTKGA